jgi:hypothetical protein
MSDPLRFVAGIAVTGLGVGLSFIPVPGVQFAAKFVIYAGVTMMTYGQFGSVQAPEQRISVTSTESPLPVVYGRHRLTHSVADVQTHGTNNSWLSTVGSICLAGESGYGIEGITNIYLFEKESSVTNPTNNNVSAQGYTTGRQAKYLKNGQEHLKYSIGTGADTQACGVNR